jgi:hypothetical protein
MPWGSAVICPPLPVQLREHLKVNDMIWLRRTHRACPGCRHTIEYIENKNINIILGFVSRLPGVRPALIY